MSYSRLFLGISLLISATSFGRSEGEKIYFVKAKATNAGERSAIANQGIAIDGVLSDAVTFAATLREIEKLKRNGVSLEINTLPEQRVSDDFPSEDKAYHTYAQVNEILDKLAADHPKLVERISIGQSLEKRELAGVRISSNPTHDALPTAIFVGCHHAREHLSVEVPLMAAQYLVEHYATDAKIKKLLDTREVWIVPLVNPDGAEYDIASGNYRYWRKNRKDSGDGNFGIDLNRNYDAPDWGGAGSSKDPSSDVFAGTKPFSEPETQAMRDFVLARKKATTMITFHTFSELVMWPWGYTSDQITNQADRKAFEVMGKKMATWNHYTAEKSSDLYLTAGDTTDWAYEKLKMFAFTIELTPNSIFSGGFYPGEKAIQPTFEANLNPILYLIEKAENPYGVLAEDADPLHLVD